MQMADKSMRDVKTGGILIFLQDYDGKLSICTEWIAKVTEQTTMQFGCGDHAHVFAEYVIEDYKGGR